MLTMIQDIRKILFYQNKLWMISLSLCMIFPKELEKIKTLEKFSIYGNLAESSTSNVVKK